MSARGIWKRVASGFSANLYGEAVTILVHLVQIPLFLSIWSPERYGVWLVLFTIPALIPLSELGLGQAAVNMIPLKKTEGNADEARRLLSGLFTFYILLIPALAILLLGTCSILPIREWLKLTALSPQLFIVLIGLLALQTGFRFVGNVSESIFRAHGAYARAVSLFNTTRLINQLALPAIGLLLFPEEWFIALLGVFGALISNTAILLYACKRHPDLTPRFAPSALSSLRPILRESLGFALGGVSRMLYLQGFVIVISSILGPAAVTLFTATRTLSQAVSKLAATVNQALWPEMTLLYGAGKHRAVARISLYSAVALGGLCLLVAGAVFWLHEPIFAVWTRGRLLPEALFMALMLGAAWLQVEANIFLLPRASRNRQFENALVGFVVVCIALWVAPTVTRAYGLPGMGVVALALQGLLLLSGVILFIRIRKEDAA